MCLDDRGDYEQRRDPTNGDWLECPKGFAACGDGLEPKIDRKKLAENKHETCKNKAGDAEEVPTCGESGDKILRDPKTGVWGKCPDEEPVNPCGDGLNPGVDRTEPEKPKCLESDKLTPETPQCILEGPHAPEDMIRLPDTGKWGCPKNDSG
jgi:hypothetical protein